MELSAKTKIDDLLEKYPFMMDFFVNRAPQFKLLQSTVMRKTVGKVATLSQVATVGGIALDRLLSEVAGKIRAETGEEVVISTDGAAIPEVSGARQEILKGIIKDLHKGVDMSLLKKRFHDLIKDIDPTEIAKMEQRLIEEGMPESEIKRLCDVHVEVFKESLEKHDIPAAPPGHPAHTFMKENRAAEEITNTIALILNKIRDSRDVELFKQNQKDLEGLLERLSGINLHYLRKENQLFPVLETHGITGPSEVMWAIHDDIRKMLKNAKRQVAEVKVPEALATIQSLTKAVNDMVYKEEHILFPMTMELLSEPDWIKVRKGEEEIGYAWVMPDEGWMSGSGTVSPKELVTAGGGSLNLETGHLTSEQVNLILKHVPLDLSFVDDNDEVLYYSQIKDRIFPRSPGVIGRKVQNCHPPRSMHMVQRILDEFRAGTKDVADFWIQINGRFIYIKYYAVRDDSGTYKGTLEAVQDVTEIQKITGEKRLLDWA